MKTSYKYIVVGCGGIGSAALYWLSRLHGAETLGLEQFELGHPRGESDDHSRIIRLSYHSPIYTALTPSAYEVWHSVEKEAGTQLVFKTGGLDFGDESQLSEFAKAMDKASIPYERLTGQEVIKRWPQFVIPEDVSCIYQADTGLVDARKANAVHITLARKYGAKVLDRTPVLDIRIKPGKVIVKTEKGKFTAEKLVVTSGAWTNNVLRSTGIKLPLKVTQEQVTYYQTPYLSEFLPDRFPVWIWRTRGDDFSTGGDFYGFPVYGEKATKAGQDLTGNVVTADTRTFEPDPHQVNKLDLMLKKHIPHFIGPILYTKTCLYTLTPDRDFIVDTLPEHPNVTVIVGAGHAFKFASLLGKISSELATDGKTAYPIQPFSIQRRALQDPAGTLE